MSREIKFRFWNKIARRFQPASKYAIDGEGKLISYDYEMMAFDDPVDFSNTCIVAQQYTGLKDKNDKEIYEGDILKCKGFNGMFDEVGFYYNGSVKHTIVKSGESQIDNLRFSESQIAGFAYIPINREVVGNIFENPELLEV
jgi:uncharacterized phage protein (TIGR01671 family)